MVESQEYQEDTIDFHYFHAEIIKDSLGGEVRITAPSQDAIIILRPVSTPVEILWYQLKEVFVNQIFLNSKQNKGIRIRSFILESYYNWVNRARGVLTKTSLSYKVRWFLSELLVVAPNSSIRKMGQLLEPTKQTLLKQYLLTNMDTMVLNLKTVATKLKNMKSVRPDMEQLLKISESGIAQVENYSFLRHLLTDLFDEEDEIVSQHIALLDHIHAEVHTTYQEILIDGVQKHLEKSGEEDNSYYDILIADLQKNLKNVDKGENLLGKTKEDDLAVAEFISDSNGGKSELKGRNIKILDENMKILKKSKELDAEKLEDFEYFILTEIGKAVKHSAQNVLHKYEGTSDVSKNVVTEDEKGKNSGKGKITLHSPQNQSKGEDKKSKTQNSFKEGIDFLRMTKSTDVKIKETVIKDEQKEKSTDSSTDMSASNAKTTDERHTLLQEIRKEISDTQYKQKTDSKTKSSNQKNVVENKIILPTDVLEEFKKPIWAASEEKDFMEFRKDSQVSKPQNHYGSAVESSESKYGKKSTNIDKDKETKPKIHTAKHIDDEL